MKKISYRTLSNNIDSKLRISEKDYSYDLIISSIPRIIKICKWYNVDFEVIEVKNRPINSLKDIETAINIKDKREKISFIYDKVCDYLDYDFIKNNKCLFMNNKCISDRNKSYIKDCGCCRAKNGKLCEYLKDNRCTIRNMGCKFFVCSTLKKQGISYKINSFPLLKYFCSFRQKIVLRYTIFVPKEKVLERVLSYRW